MGVLIRINSLLQRGAEAGVVFFMAVIGLVIPYEVLGRYVFGDMPTWSGEVATYSLVWVSMLGSAAGLRRGYQIGIRFLLEKLPAPVSHVVEHTSRLVLLSLLGILFYYSLLQTGVNWRQISPAMEIPMAIPYAALPLGFGMMGLFTLETLLSGNEEQKGGRGSC